MAKEYDLADLVNSNYIITVLIVIIVSVIVSAVRLV